MKSSEKLFRIIGDIDENLIHKADTITFKRAKVYNLPWKSYAGVAAVLMLCVVGVMLNFGIGGDDPVTTSQTPPENSVTRDDSIAPSPPDTGAGSIRGLPTRNFDFSELLFPTPDNLFVIRTLSDYFGGGGNHQVDHVVIVRNAGQDSTILSNISGDGDLSGSVRVMYRVGENLVNSEYTNSLRRGGVYILALQRTGEVGVYSMWGDLTALFEIDNNGFVFTHSQQFADFDGLYYTDVIALINAL
jgi:hypothetical protein